MQTEGQNTKFQLEQQRNKIKILIGALGELHSGTAHRCVTALTNNALWTNCTQGHALMVCGNDSRE